MCICIILAIKVHILCCHKEKMKKEIVEFLKKFLQKD